MTATRKSLSPVQRRVMDLLHHGWITQPGDGASIYINGKRVCNVDTMMALQRKGLVERVDGGRVGEWKSVTEIGE